MTSKLEALFVTKLCRVELSGPGSRRLVDDLEISCRSIAAEDKAGQAWSRDKGYKGYTSYASLDDLAWRDPVFADLVTHLDGHVSDFGRDLDFDLAGRRLSLDSIWINILKPGGLHTAHIHPHSAISGTVYVAVPAGSSALRLEDPRLAMMMAAPPRKDRARIENRTFVDITPKAGTVLLWESWLRHEVPVNSAKSDRISISFNYRWD